MNNYKVISYDNFIIEAMKYFDEHIPGEDDDIIELIMERMKHTNHNCDNANIIKTIISSCNSNLRKFEYYDICITTSKI